MPQTFGKPKLLGRRWGNQEGPQPNLTPPSPANPAELPKSWPPSSRSRGDGDTPKAKELDRSITVGMSREEATPSSALWFPVHPLLTFVLWLCAPGMGKHRRASPRRRSLLPWRCRAGDELHRLRASAKARVLFAGVGKVQIEPPAALVPTPRSIAHPCTGSSRRHPHRPPHTAGSRAPGPGRHGPPKPSRAKTRELCKT